MKKNKRKGKDVQEELQKELQKELDREVHTHFAIAPFMEKEKKKKVRRKRDLSSGV